MARPIVTNFTHVHYRRRVTALKAATNLLLDHVKITSASLTILVLAQILLAQAFAQATLQPVKKEMTLVSINDSSRHEYAFEVGGVRLKSMEALEAHLATWTAGSEVVWDPGCVRLGNEPLLSSETEMKRFIRFLESKRIRLTIVPAG